MHKNIENLVNTLKNKLSGIDGIKAAYLYGSALRSDYNSESDTDIFILAEDKEKPIIFEKEIKEALRDIPRADITIIFVSEYESGFHPGWSNFFFLNLKRNNILLKGEDIIKNFDDHKINFDEAYRRIVWLCQRVRGVFTTERKSEEIKFWEKKLKNWIPICVSEILYLNGVYESAPSKAVKKFFQLNKKFNNKIDIKNASLNEIHSFLEELRLMCLKMKQKKF